jgi:hypothetical protein
MPIVPLCDKLYRAPRGAATLKMADGRLDQFRL